MLKALSRRPLPAHRETILSFLSRIAAMNGVSASAFALDMGFTLKKIINLEKDAVRNLAKCGGLSDEQMGELISWTGQKVGDVRIEFRDEVFVSRAVRNPTIRGCPICLRDDAGTIPSHPFAHMVMRGDWQLRELNLCVEHHHPLVSLWEHERPTGRFDTSTRLAEILPDILEGRLERSRVTPSPYDLWLSNRLDTGSDNTWLADKSLYAATTFCKLLGTELLRLQVLTRADGLTDDTTANIIGYNIACRGEGSIRNALNTLATFSGGHNDEPNKAFGQLYADLGRAHLNKADFAPFRKLLRECIIENWPVAAGEDVLGIIQEERQLHSIVSAAHETGIGAGLLEQFLEHARAISADDERPKSRKTFDAKAHAELLAEIPALVGSLEMKKRIGATQHQLASLAEDNILQPRVDVPTIRAPWRIADGLALITELNGMANSIQPTDKRWETIQMAKCRSDLRVGTLITAVRMGQLQLGQREGVWGYAGFCLLKSEVDALNPVRKDGQMESMISAAVFARSIGMRSEGWFEKLVAAGHTPGTRMPHPKLGGMRVYASKEDIDKFHLRFLTPSTMEREFQVHKRTLLAKLKAAHVEAFAPNAQDFGALYLRKDVEVAIKPAQIVLRK